MKQNNPRLNIVFFGTPLFVVPVLQTLIENFDVVGIVTTPDVPLGRKKIMTPTPVKQTYQKYLENTDKNGLIIGSPKLNNGTMEQLSNCKPDLFVVAAYGQIIPKNILDIPKYGSLNIHPSLLPKYRGPSPIQSAILAGEIRTGVTIIEMDEEIDHGPILAQKEVQMKPEDTFASLHNDLFGLAANMLPEVIRDYTTGKHKLIPQNDNLATYTKHITRQDGFIDITNINSMSSFEIKNLKLEIAHKMRAYYPWPTAWTKWEGKIVKLLPGKRIQMEGKRPTSYKDFFNGHKGAKEVFEHIL